MANEVHPIKSKRDFNKLKNALHGRDRLLLTLGTAFGLRIGDLLKLKIGDLRGKKSLTIRETKRRKVRTITFSKSVLREIETLTGSDEEYVFKSRKGDNHPISRVQAYRILHDAAKRAGIDKNIGNIGTHTLRKTFGYRLYENGYDVSRIMAILGHSSEKETLRYIGVTADEIAEAYESIEV